MDSDEETLLLALLLRRKLRKRKRKSHRQFWENPLWSNRSQESEYFALYSNNIKNNESKFYKYLRMPETTFDELLEVVQSDIQYLDTNLRVSVSPEERLVITLRYLATGASLTDLQYSFKRGFSTIQRIVRTTCKAIINNLFYICKPPTQARHWINIAKGFKDNSNFPNCIGAIDGKHVRIIRPCDSGHATLYFNYKKYFSTNLLAICNSNYEFIYVDVGSYGKSSDSTIFLNSSFKKDLEEGILDVPPPTPVTENGDPLPFVFVGDEAFPLSGYVQRPIANAGNHLTHKQKVYNYRLSRARRYIECSFGIMTSKWRILQRPLNVGLDFSEEIIKTCCILHNFVRSKKEHTQEQSNIPRDSSLVDNSHIDLQNTVHLSRGVFERNKFADYFLSRQGAVPWQNDKI